MAVRGVHRILQGAGEDETEEAGLTMPPNRKRLYLIIATLGLLGLAGMVAILVYVLI